MLKMQAIDIVKVTCRTRGKKKISTGERGWGAADFRGRSGERD
jgi:hypothetical protein